ncbi:GntR family transcriptional regulator [Actibacterium sp. D379-3]
MSAKRIGTRVVSSGSLSGTVYEKIRGILLRLEIEPGQRITIDEIAQKLEVSQTPVREALSRLEAEGLVRRIPNVGYCVADALTPDQVAEMYELRQLIEPFALRRACERMSEEDMAKMTEVQRRTRRMFVEGRANRFENFIELDSAFHKLIAKGSGNVFVSELIDRAHDQLQFFRLLFDANLSLDAINEHDAVLDALIARDAPQAEAAMRIHLENANARVRHFLEERQNAEQRE